MGSTAKAGKDKGDSKKKKGALSSEEQKEMDDLKMQIEQYRERLVKEFGYSKKEIKADPEMNELEDKLKAFEKRRSAYASPALSGSIVGAIQNFLHCILRD